jgi:transposase
MANVLSREKREQVLALGRLGWSLRRIEEATGVRRETTSGYLKTAGIAVRAPRTRLLPSNPASQVSTDSGPNPASQVSTDSGPNPAGQVSTDPSDLIRPGRCPSASACEPYRDFIEQSLNKGRNAMAIWQDLVDDHGFDARYSSVRRFVRRLQAAPGRQARCVITTAPGEECQVDYGTGPMVRHPDTDQYRRTRLFVLTLGHSRKSVRLLTFKSSARIWVELHERAFRRLGGVTRVVVLDNLREGVLKPDIYDPELNPLYRDMLKHNGSVAMPCRVNDPNRKGKVERGVGHAKQTPLKGLRFESLEEAQAYLDRWEQRWADTRIHGTTKRQVQVMFAEEQAALLPLPLEPFRYYEHGKRTVHLDGCVEVAGAYYGTPPGWLGKQVNVQWDAMHVRIIAPRTGELLREHLVQRRGGFRIEPQDRPKQTPKTTRKLLERAHRAGADIGVLCAEIHRREGETGIRRILGVLSLVKKYGAVVVNEASAMATELGIADYRFVRRYLERHAPAPLTLRQVDPLIRELTHYRDVIHRMTEGDTP